MTREPYYQDDDVTVYHGDCVDVLATLPADSVDAVVTDPPYDLTAAKKGGSGAASIDLESPYGRARIGTGNGAGGFMGKAWDATGIAFDPEVWRLCLRVLKPGGHLVAFGGTRTWHRLACAVEDAGFEMRDSMAWLYGSGFPKSMDVSKAIDKAAGATRRVVGTGSSGAAGIAYQRGAPSVYEVTEAATDAAKQWQGWGTALKPAFEPIVLARKPFRGSVANNVLTHGTGALNIDACRVGTAGETTARPPLSTNKHEGYQRPWNDDVDARARLTASREIAHDKRDNIGRWPPNVAVDDSQAAEIDKQSGHSTSPPIGSTAKLKRPQSTHTVSLPPMELPNEYGDAGGASRFFPTFRYEPKAPGHERPNDDGTAHPTVKPLDLMRWLVRLVTPRYGVVLDPFAGSGTTAQACLHEYLRCITIEADATYLPLIVNRLSKAQALGIDFGDLT